MAISSEFHKDVSKVERRMWGITKRQLKAYFYLALVMVVMVAEIFLLPEWAFWIISIPTSLVLSIYPLMLLLNKWKEVRRKIELEFYYEDRVYQSGQIRRYDKSEFIQREGVKETDDI